MRRCCLPGLLLLLPLSGQAGEPFPSAVLEAFNADHPELAFESAPEVSPFEAQVIRQADTESAGKRVALTFDACSRWTENRFDETLLEKLRETEVPATLFLGGRWMYEHPELTRELHEDPRFEIANHAHAHPDLTDMEADDVAIQIGYAQLMGKALTGEFPRFFRPPFVREDETVREIAGELGLVTIQYDVASGDAEESAEPEAVAGHVLENIEPGSIVVLHMHNPELPTARALPLILEGLKERGLEPTTVGRLLDSG